MELKLLAALDRPLAETKRHLRRVLTHTVVMELADDIGLSARKDFNFHGWVSASRAPSPSYRFPLSSDPEVIAYLDRLAGIEAL